MLEQNPILESISNWFKRTFSDPAAIGLFMTLVAVVLVLELFGHILMPILVSAVVAYLLQSVVRLLERWRVPHLAAVMIVFFFFLGIIIFAFVTLIPLLIKQLSNLIIEFPQAFIKSQSWFVQWVHRYPRIFSEVEVQEVTMFLKEQSIKIGKIALQYSLTSIPGAIQVILYLVLVPLLVYFFLKDSNPILNWFGQFLPGNRSLVTSVWRQVNVKIGAYIRARVFEVVLVGLVTTIVFAFLGLQYSVLLGSLVGLSVIVPYIGAVVVTIPVVIVALMQWGVSAQFTYLIIAYVIIIIIDANILVPFLFAESMDLHPAGVIIAVVIFGAIWGFWGVFFAIPLATVVNVVLKAWPRVKVQPEKTA